MILFIFAVTSGSIQGWATPYVLAPLIISVLLLVAFFVWEAHIDEIDAAMYVLSSPFHLAMMLMFLPAVRHRYGDIQMYQSSQPLPCYPTFGGSLFSSRTLHGLRVGSVGLRWTPRFICELPSFSCDSSLNLTVFQPSAWRFSFYCHQRDRISSPLPRPQIHSSHWRCSPYHGFGYATIHLLPRYILETQLPRIRHWHNWLHDPV